MQTSARRLLWELFASKAEAVARSQAEGIRTNCGWLRTKCVSLGDLIETGALFSLSPQAGRGEDLLPKSGVVVAPDQAEPRLDLGDLGPADGNPVG